MAAAVTGIVEAAGAHVPVVLARIEERLAVLADGHGPVLAGHAGTTIAAGGKRLRPLLVVIAAGGRTGHGVVRAGGLDDPRDGGGHRPYAPFVPAWMAMMPPAVTTYRSSPRPAAAIAAASAGGAGKRFTELGR